jgi:hypothetical protein
VKALLKKALWSIGYEIRKRRSEFQPDGPAPTDEVIDGPWLYHVLQMSNRYYHPDVLQYHRTKYGEDQRLKYIAYFLDVRDQRVLEIGPLEGHHSVILEKMGVRENISIESRSENLRKCQRVKEKYCLDNTRFVQADLERLCTGEDVPSFSGPFDLVFCLGVLYHLPDPGRGLEWMRSQGSTLFLGTHYAEANIPQDEISYHYDGQTYRACQVMEGGPNDLLSGMSPTALYLYEYDLLRLVHDVGYSRVSVLGKDLQNNAPHITVFAEA